MAGNLRARVAVGAALLTLGACAYATPYPAAFPEEGRWGVAPADSGRSDGCEAAINAPSDRVKVHACLRARGQAWDNRGRAIRQQAGYVGQLAIPLGIATLGLAASGDTSDFVPITAGVTAAALAHTGAYARPTQAEVYEMATVSYRCLLTGVAEWNSADKQIVNDALARLEAANLAASRAAIAADDQDIVATLAAQIATARQTHATLDGTIGTALLRHSDDIDAAVIRAIRDQLPDPQAIAAGIATGTIGNTPVAGRPSTGGPDRAPGPSGNRGNLDRLVAESDAAARAFDAAAAAYASAARASTNCAFNPSQLAVLEAIPAALTVDKDTGKGFFVIRNGVPPYGYMPLPTGVTLTMTPINGNAVRFEVTIPDAKTYKIYITDASAAGSVVEVTVTRPES